MRIPLVSPYGLVLLHVSKMFNLEDVGGSSETGRTLAPDAENQLAFNAGNILAPDAS